MVGVELSASHGRAGSRALALVRTLPRTAPATGSAAATGLTEISHRDAPAISPAPVPSNAMLGRSYSVRSSAAREVRSGREAPGWSRNELTRDRLIAW